MYDLITPEQIESLPEDPPQRFVGLEAICRDSYNKLVRNEDEWSEIAQARVQYMGAIIAAAKRFKIEPLSDWEAPRQSNFQQEQFTEFMQDVQFYRMQLMLENAEAKVETSILLVGTTKQKLRSLTAHIRTELYKLELPASRLDRLANKLNDFESELENPRLRLVTVALLSLGVAGAISDVSGATTAIRQLVNQVEKVVGQAKEQQDIEAAARLPTHVSPARLEPPRVHVQTAAPEREEFSQDLEDEIPF